MCSQKSENISDESMQSMVDTEVDSPAETPNPQISGSESSSDSESTISHDRKRSSDGNQNNKTKTGENLKSHDCSSSLPKRKRINYESVSSLSVSSSPESTATKRSEDASNSESKIFRSHLSAFHSNDQHKLINGNISTLRNSSILIPMPITMMPSKIQQEYKFKGFSVDHNHNHHSNSKMRHHSSESNSNEEDERNMKKTSTTIKSKLSFGIDRILSDENSRPEFNTAAKSKECDDSPLPSLTSEPVEDQISKMGFSRDLHESIRHLNFNHLQHQQFHSHHHSNALNLERCCTDSYLLSRYCRTNPQYSSLLVNSSPGTVNMVSSATGGSVHASFPPWMSSSMYENSPLLSPSAYHPQSSLPASYGMNASNFSTMSLACNTAGGRRKRSWSRAVFSSLQRKGLEKRFQIQKYITKPDRRALASTLGLTDAQVKVWFQNRRMKWRHSKEGKVTSGVGESMNSTPSSTTSGVTDQK